MRYQICKVWMKPCSQVLTRYSSNGVHVSVDLRVHGKCDTIYFFIVRRLNLDKKLFCFYIDDKGIYAENNSCAPGWIYPVQQDRNGIDKNQAEWRWCEPWSSELSANCSYPTVSGNRCVGAWRNGNDCTFREYNMFTCVIMIAKQIIVHGKTPIVYAFNVLYVSHDAPLLIIRY